MLEIDLTRLGVDLDDFGRHLVAERHHVAGALDVPIRHLPHVKQRFAAGADIHKRTVSDDPRHCALDDLIGLERNDINLWRFAHRQANAVSLAVEFFDPDVDVLPLRDHVRDLIDSIIAQLRDVDQTVAAHADVDECAEVGHPLDLAAQLLTDSQFLYYLLLAGDSTVRRFGLCRVLWGGFSLHLGNRLRFRFL